MNCASTVADISINQSGVFAFYHSFVRWGANEGSGLDGMAGERAVEGRQNERPVIQFINSDFGVTFCMITGFSTPPVLPTHTIHLLGRDDLNYQYAELKLKR